MIFILSLGADWGRGGYGASEVIFDSFEVVLGCCGGFCSAVVVEMGRVVVHALAR